MKSYKILFLISFLTLKSLAQEAVITLNQPSIIYSLPKKELCIELEIEKTVQQPGIYFQYSERYLATNQVFLEEKTSFQLKSIQLSTHSVADPNRMFVIQPTKKSILNYISVNELGIICGVNIPVKNIGSEIPKLFNPIIENTRNTSSLLPLGEEYLMAGSVAKLAEGAAKQIYRIRESRLSLLTGDLEHLPADGASMQSMIDGLNKSEKELTELFIGKSVTTVEKHKITISIDSVMNNNIAFRLSTFKGLVNVNDLAGNPYFISVHTNKVNVKPADPKLKQDILNTINTVLPAKTLIELSDGVKTICSLNTEMPQFGILIPLSTSTIGTSNFKIYIDPQTGRLLSIEK
ncbi:MAG: DUF4831 family protein [Paludibacter sp.]